MKLYSFRHNKFEASWSQFSEPNVFREGYMFAELIVLAENLEQAYELISSEKEWDLEEVKRLEARVISLDEARGVSAYVHRG